ncbi:MAG: hypothetical protein L0322_25305, partial [Chloroflexi bacterium]|nr:hypothetical protein [Chloroflexota bacterium]
MAAIPDIVAWAESPAGFCLKETRKPIRLASHQRDILRHCFTAGPDGRLPYETVVYSCPKKSGKTTLAALATLYFALFIEPEGGEIYVCANDLEQSQARVYSDVATAVRLNPVLAGRTTVQTRVTVLDNGTTINALPSDYAGAAGSRHGLTVWDELWAYTTESARRLWDELTPVPTRLNSIRFIATYAGFQGESELLEELQKRGRAGQVVEELAHIDNGRGEPACRAAGRTFVYWDHELKPHPGLTITPEAYHEQQRQDLRPTAFTRIHLNDFSTNESQFVEPEQWAACYDPALTAWTAGDGRRLTLGADASTARDFTALVGCCRGSRGGVDVAYVKVWKPQKSNGRGRPTIDLDKTIGAEILSLHRAGAVVACYYDPYQLHSIATRLRAAGVKMIELPQTNARIECDQAL